MYITDNKNYTKNKHDYLNNQSKISVYSFWLNYTLMLFLLLKTIQLTTFYCKMAWNMDYSFSPVYIYYRNLLLTY